MLPWMHFYIRLCFLKEAPQDAPYSKTFLYFGIITYYLVGVLITSFTQSWGVSVVMSLIQTAILMFLTNLLLWIRKSPERYEQTLSALTFSGAIIGIAALPVITMLTSVGGEEGFASLLWVVLILWETLVVAHIYRHSMDITLPGGLGISLVYMYLSFAITLRLLKIIAAPL